MTSEISDVTIPFNKDNAFVLDVSLWENVTVQFVSPSGTINITGTNDGLGSTDPLTKFGTASTAANFTAIQATNLATGAATTSVAAAGLYRIVVGCKYIKFGGASAAATKVLVYSNKPY